MSDKDKLRKIFDYMVKYNCELVLMVKDQSPIICFQADGECIKGINYFELLEVRKLIVESEHIILNMMEHFKVNSINKDMKPDVLDEFRSKTSGIKSKM